MQTNNGRKLAHDLGIIDVATCSLIARHAVTHARIQEELCNGPNNRFFDHATTAQIDQWQKDCEKRDEQCEARITKLVERLGPGFGVIFGGDPRGVTVKITTPDKRTNDSAREGICANW